MIPIPPPRAMAMAISASVTVSMGLETKGAFRVIFFVKALVNSTSLGVKSMYPGNMMKSLYVRPWPSPIKAAPVMPSSGTYVVPPQIKCSAMVIGVIEDDLERGDHETME